MGIWSVWVPFGSTAMFIIAPLLAVHWGWRAVWQFGWCYTIVVGLLFYFLVESPTGLPSDQDHSDSCKNLTIQSLSLVLRNRNLWLISLLFCCFNFVVVAFITWGPTFLHGTRHASIIRAAHIMSLMSILNMAAAPLAGWMLDKTGSRKLLCALPLLAMAFLFPANATASENLFIALTVAIGLFGGFVPTGVFSSAVEIVGDERLTGMAMAVIQIGQNSGMLLGPLVFGWLVESLGWQAAFWALAPVGVVGAVSGLAANFSRQRPVVSCQS